MERQRIATLNYMNHLHEEKPDREGDVYWSNGKIIGVTPVEEPKSTQVSAEFNHQSPAWTT